MFQPIGFPFDLHRPNERMGRTPAALLPRLAELGLPLAEAKIASPSQLVGDPDRDLAAALAALAEVVRETHAQGLTPLVIGGDCMTSLGVVGGLRPHLAGLTWIDAHGDFNTPAISPSGYYGGMPLAAIAGRCLEQFTRATGQGTPLPGHQIALLGARDLDPLEAVALAEAGVAVVTTAEVQRKAPKVRGALEQSCAGPTYLHLDVDVLDQSVLPGAVYPTANGLSLVELNDLLRTVIAERRPTAITLTALNLVEGQEEAQCTLALEILRVLLSEG